MNGASLEMFDSIRTVLNGRPFPEEQRRELAMRMSETSEIFRRRVDRAVRYARLGLRLEAACEAEAEPTLFDLAQHLDSEDLHKWRALCVRQQWPVPEAPDAAALGEIEEAISQLRPLRKLLSRMRLLVLSDAGPWERLAVLRELVNKDHHNPAWHADREALEPVAAQWLVEQCEHAIRAGHLTAAEHFIEHLEDGHWHALATGPRASILRARLNSAVVAECATLAPDALAALESEWAAESAPGVMSQLERWRELEVRAVEHGGSLPVALVERAATVESWLSDRRAGEDAQKEHEACAAALEELLLRDRTTLGELRRALHACEATAEGCPEHLRRQALDQIAAHERKRAARRTALVGVSVVVVVGVVAAIWYGVSHAAKSSRVETLAAAIRSHVAAGQLDDASRILAEADQEFEIAGDERMTAARREYMNARNTIARGDRDFDGLMAAAGDPDSPDARTENVERAGQLARTEAQHKAVSEWNRLHRRAADSRATSLAQEQLKSVRELQQQLAAGQGNADETAWMGTLSAAEATLGALERAAHSNPSVLDEVRRAQTLVAAQRGAMQSAREDRLRVDALRGLAAHAQDPAALRVAMERFSNEHAGTPEAQSLAAALSAAPLWQAIADWNAVMQGRAPTKAATMKQSERDSLHSALRAYATANAGAPMAAPARSFATLLVPADGWRLWMEDKLQLPAFSYFVIELKDGTRYYTLQDPTRLAVQTEPGGKTYKIVSVLTTGGVDPKSSFQRIDESAIKSQGPSPQAAFAAAIKAQLEEPDSDPTVANGVQAALTVLAKVRDTEAMDGVFAAQIARGVLESLEPELPTALKEPIQAATRKIIREKPEGTDWVAGGTAARDRSRAFRAVLKDALKVEQWRKAYSDAIVAAAAPLQNRYAPVAIVLDPATRSIASSGAGALPSNADLFALRVGVGNEPSTMVQVGKTDAKGTISATPEAAQFSVGTLVFARQGGGS